MARPVAFPNSVTTTYTYDALDRLIEFNSKTSTGEVLQSYHITLGPSGNRVRIDEDDGISRHYQYDALHRLTQERVADSADVLTYQRDFTYDPVGNRLEQAIDEGEGPMISASVYDSRDRLLSTNATTYAWDNAGNLASRTDTGEISYGWDFNNRLISVRLDDDTLVETSYDVDGNRIRTAVTPPGGSTAAIYYLVDTNGPLSHVVADIVGGSIQTLYTRAADELIGLYRPASGMQRYYHADGLGSVRLLSDQSGTITDRYTYSAFGEIREHAGTDFQPYQFAGEPLDPNIDFYFNRERWLDVKSGRFISADPFPSLSSDPLTLHRYLYASQNPINKVDPTGLFSAGEISIANGIRGILSNIQVDVGINILTMPPLDPDGEISKALILASLAAGGYALLKNWRSLLRSAKQIGKGAGTATRRFFNRMRNWARVANMSWPSGIPKSEGLEMASDLRRMLNLNPMEHNIAIAEVSVTGRKDLLYSISGQASPPGTVPAPMSRRFSARKTRGAITTANDSEVKILEKLAAELLPDAEGRISLYTERQPCPSCSWPDPLGVIEQFKEAFPNVKFEVTWSYNR